MVAVPVTTLCPLPAATCQNDEDEHRTGQAEPGSEPSSHRNHEQHTDSEHHETLPAVSKQQAASGKKSGISTDLFVAVTLTVTIPGPEVLGVTVHAVTLADPAQVNATIPVNPPSPLTVTGKVVATPLGTLTAPLGPVREKSQAVPVSDTDCGLPVALSVKVIDPVSDPGAVDDAGLNVTIKVQGVPAGAIVMGNVLPQEFEVIVKSELLDTIFEMTTGVAPVLLRVTVFAALVVVKSCPPNVRLVGLIVIVATDTVAVPVSGTDCGLLPALSVKVIDPVTGPAGVDNEGLNVTLRIHGVPPGETAMVIGNVEPQELLVMVKLAFEDAMAEMFNGTIVLGLLIMII